MKRVMFMAAIALLACNNTKSAPEISERTEETVLICFNSIKISAIETGLDINSWNGAGKIVIRLKIKNILGNNIVDRLDIDYRVIEDDIIY